MYSGIVIVAGVKVGCVIGEAFFLVSFFCMLSVDACAT